MSRVAPRQPSVNASIRLSPECALTRRLAASYADWRSENGDRRLARLTAGEHQQVPTTTEPSVCLITGEFPPAVGGVADYTALLAQHLAGRGAGVTVVTTLPEAEGTRTAAPSPGEGDPSWREEPEGAHELARWRTRFVRGWSSRQIGDMAEVIQAARPDVVHLQYQAAAFGMAAAVNALPFLLRARGVRAPMVTTFHDLRVP